MRTHRALPAVAAVALAASHLLDGVFILAGAAILLIIVLACSLPAHETRPWTRLATGGALVALAVLPGSIAARPGLPSAALGLLAAAALLGLGTAPTPPGQVSGRAWVSHHYGRLAVTLALAAVLLASAALALSTGPARLRLSEEWHSATGLLLGALPWLAIAAMGILAWTALQREQTPEAP